MLCVSVSLFVGRGEGGRRRTLRILPNQLGKIKLLLKFFVTMLFVSRGGNDDNSKILFLILDENMYILYRNMENCPLIIPVTPSYLDSW